MFSNPVLAGTVAFLMVFALIAAVGYYLTVRAFRGQWRAIYRLREMAAEVSSQAVEPGQAAAWTWSALPKLGALVVSNEKRQVVDLRTKLLHAGYFHPSAALYFVGVKLLMMVLFAVGGGLAPLWIGVFAWQRILVWALASCAVGYLVPGLWLSTQIEKRRRLLRNALPDALDILVLCLEAGLSLHAAIQWVAHELPAVHPALGAEINIVEREMELGLSAGQALRNFADRCGLADVRDLASILLQSDRYGASIAKTLRIYADSARQDRQQKAEEMAQKAAVKILFPTLLCIFPAIFIVLLGPAAFQMAGLFVR